MTKKKILAVDDNSEVLELLKMILTNNGFEVITAMDGIKALELVREKDNLPDLILLDLTLPRLDGYKVCRRLKYSNEYKQIPIIILSGLSESKDKLLGLASEADDYVTKPFQQEDLLQKINKLLGQEVK
jgi:DNA-binding response OmpR family regulator